MSDVYVIVNYVIFAFTAGVMVLCTIAFWREISRTSQGSKLLMIVTSTVGVATIIQGSVIEAALWMVFTTYEIADAYRVDRLNQMEAALMASTSIATLQATLLDKRPNQTEGEAP